MQLEPTSAPEKHFVDYDSVSSLGSYLHPRSFTKIIRRLSYALTPDILRTKLLHEEQHARPTPSATAYLDGLRGLAALAVFNYHYLFAFTDSTAIGFAQDKSHHSLIELPFVRLFHDGGTCVIIFFTVAGYVCSARSQQLMTTGQQDKALKGLCASVFRRGFRLYLPVMVVTLLTTLATYIGLFEPMRPMIDNRKVYFPGAFSEGGLPRLASFTAQMHLWWNEMSKLLDVWNITPYYAEHDPHLWTIPFEFRMSMHLYIALLGTTFCRPVVRLCGLILLGTAYLMWGRWEGPLFFFGAALAQWNAMKNAQPSESLLSNPPISSTLKRPHLSVRVARALGYFSSLYLMSFPIANAKRPAPGFKFLNRLIPVWYKRKEKFPKSIGTVWFLYLLSTSQDKESSSLHSMLRSEFAQSLGQRMFALYLVHGPLLHCFGYGVPHATWSVIGKESNFQWWTGVLIGWVFNLTICSWVADVFTREIDSRIAKSIRWLEKRLCV